VANAERLHEVLNRLAEAEKRFLAGEFLAPVPHGGQVQVRIAGVICKLKVEPANFQGWGVFQPTSHTSARLLRRPTLAERQRYLRLFSRLGLILCDHRDDGWFAVPAHQADRRFRIDGVVPVRLVEEVQLFEVIECRFDGSQFWYEGPDERRDPGTAAYLRRSLNEMTEPERLSRPGLTPEERRAYALNYGQRLRAEEEARRNRTESRLRDALAHAGAEYLDHLERGDSYRVEYEVAGRRHVSAIARDDLTVMVAGICLSGEDAQFDLQSLVGVLREAEVEGGALPIGEENQGMPEDQYWDVHPPRQP
jgi:hypothetical protein